MSKSSPFDLMCGGKLFGTANPLGLEDLGMESSTPPEYNANFANHKNKVSPAFSILCTPLINRSNSTIDTIFIQSMSLIEKARFLLAGDATIDQLYRLKLEAENLKDGYDTWPKSLSEDWGARSVGVIAVEDGEIT
jgi:hypothetical protein